MYLDGYKDGEGYHDTRIPKKKKKKLRRECEIGKKDRRTREEKERGISIYKWIKNGMWHMVRASKKNNEQYQYLLNIRANT